MKRLKYGLLAAAMVASSAAFIPASADAATEGWQTASNGKRWYQYEDGSYAKNEFIGGYWINKAGWVDDTTTYSWQKFGGQKTEEGARWQFGNTTWLAGLTKEKNQWWKIDGYWYYFHKDGFMGQNEFIGKYYVDQQGVWDPEVRGAWEKQTNGTWKFKVTKGDDEWYEGTKEGTDWVRISGYDYHFGEDGTLDTWKVIVDDLNGDGDIDLPYIDRNSDGEDVAYTQGEVFALGANGHLGRYTQFSVSEDETEDAEYKLSFDFASVGDAKAAMAEFKEFLLGAYYNKAGMKPEDSKWFHIETPTVGDREVIIGIGAKDATTDATIVLNEDGTITYNAAKSSKVYTPNVFITLSEDEYDYLQNLEAYGLKKYDGSYLSYMVATDEWEGITKWAIPITNYANYFVKTKKVDIIFETSFYNLFTQWAGFSASTALNFDFTITAADVVNGGTVEMKVSHLGMSANYIVVKVDGVNYQGYYDVYPVKDKQGNILYWDYNFFFLSDVHGDKALGRKLYNAGIIDAYRVFNCLTDKCESTCIDPDDGENDAIDGWVLYALEDLYKQKAATSTNQ